jgi:hypothetical protein
MSPAIIIHNLPQARLALSPGRPVTLLSAPAAGQFMGVLWWHELLSAAGHTGPSLLDCGTAPGRALEALKLRLPGLILRTTPAAFAQVAALATAQSAILLTRPPPALDLAGPNASRQLESWLNG